MSPRVRQVALTAHVITSVGWLGAVAAFVALALVGLTGDDIARGRAAYVAMDLIAGYVIVPACLASLVTGLIQGLGSPWGLVRHYWVVIKLVLACLATAVLLQHLRPIADAAGIATRTTPRAAADLGQQLVVDAGAALVVLVVTTALSVFKSRGMTRHGQRRAPR